MSMKLGRKPRTFDQRVPHWSSLIFQAAPQPLFPPAHNWIAGMPTNFGMMLNDQLGDCVIADVYHSREVWSYVAQKSENVQPDSMVLQTYEQACSYDPRDPRSDQGCNEQQVLSWWTRTGIPLAGGGHDKLLAFIEIDVRNLDDVMDAIYQCGAVMIGFNVPQYILPDGSPPPSVWRLDSGADNRIIGGHAVPLVGYDRTVGLFNLISWGATYEMSTEFFQQFADEAYALVDSSWIDHTGKTPLGLTKEQLEAAMQAIKG